MNKMKKDIEFLWYNKDIGTEEKDILLNLLERIEQLEQVNGIVDKYPFYKEFRDNEEQSKMNDEDF